MAANTVHSVEIVFLILLAFIVVLANLARRLQIPYPIVLVIGGLVLGFVPGMPQVTLNPDMVFLVVLPPLLYAAAWTTSWRDFSYNLVSITMLAFGMVGFTVLCVAVAAPFVFPGFDWQTGLVLGAVVSTTDAIAATSIARRIRLPQRIVDILEGESLVNDATGLLALEFGLSMLAKASHPTIALGLFRLLYLTAAGLVVGLLVGYVINWYERSFEDAPVEIVITILVPYAAYLAAESIHASGVLAVVSCGLYLSYRSNQLFSASVRIQVYSVWNALTFLFNGLVFVLIGLQLPYVLRSIEGYGLDELLVGAALFVALLILLRLVWVYPGAYFAYFIRNRFFYQKDKPPPPKQVFVVAWTGMRGVVALAAAIALPRTRAGGAPFTQRNLIIFLTFSVIFVTLVLQGLTLPALIRKLGLGSGEVSNIEEAEARRSILEAVLEFLEERRVTNDPRFAGIYEDVSRHYRHRLASVTRDFSGVEGATVEHLSHYRALAVEIVSLQRAKAVGLRNQRKINDEVLRVLEYELDLEESRLAQEGSAARA